MNILEKMIDTWSIERWGSTLDPMNLISLREEEFSEIGSVLSSDTSYECFFHSEYYLWLDYIHTVIFSKSNSAPNILPIRFSNQEVVSLNRSREYYILVFLPWSDTRPTSNLLLGFLFMWVPKSHEQNLPTWHFPVRKNSKDEIYFFTHRGTLRYCLSNQK